MIEKGKKTFLVKYTKLAIGASKGTNSVAVCILNICVSLITKHTQTNTSR